MLRAILWRAAALVAALLAVRFLATLLEGSLGRALRARSSAPCSPRSRRRGCRGELPGWLGTALRATAVASAATGLAVLATRALSRRRRRYVRMRIVPYRTDHAGPEALARMYAALHAALLERWWRRLLRGQPSAALETWFGEGRRGVVRAQLPTCPRRAAVRAVLQAVYPNVRVIEERVEAELPPVLVRLKKHAGFIRRTATPARFPDRDAQPPIDGLLRAMAAGPRSRPRPARADARTGCRGTNGADALQAS